ncbi:cytosine-purine permease [Schizopora paradoxa]|uniref:Cytosine-purine permease n=1 Tax=Schizopora paradoxa TaxID=27342 RepID=A0A0H2RKS9_9AGAM|nr:cytosine-purine permease [Schizopora paradoxa]
MDVSSLEKGAIEGRYAGVQQPGGTDKKDAPPPSLLGEKEVVAVDSDSSSTGRQDFLGRLRKRCRNALGLLEIETNGIEPVPRENRTDNRIYEMFLVWFSANFNVLAFSTGSVGPAVFGLSLRQSFAVIVLVDAISFIIPGYFAIFGPKLGTRVMVQARFSFGYLGSIVPSLLNVFSLEGFLILNSIIGGQTLASVSSKLSWDLGIVIIGLISLLVTFCGYRVVHWYETVAWIPNAITFLVMIGVGAKHLVNAPSTPGAGVSAIISFASTTAATDLSWSSMVADYGVYHNASASSRRIVLYTYLGFFVSSIVMHLLGAAFAASAPFVPSWNAGFDNASDIGGLMFAVLSPLGGFGKFLTVLVALTVPSACAPTMYSFGTSFMNVAVVFARVPRSVYAIVSTAILMPVAIVGSTRFYATFVDLISIIGYWTASFSAIVTVEHVVFRRQQFWRYNVEDWKDPRRLPLGVAAALAFFGSFGIIVPSMSQVWYVGPIARAGTGDIGIFTGFVSAAVLYLVLRAAELRFLRCDIPRCPAGDEGVDL